MKSEMPKDMMLIISDLKKTKTKERCLQDAYNFVISNFKASRIKTYLLLHRLLITDVYKNWNSRDYLHCTNLNGILAFLLIESGHFKEQEILKKWTLLYYLSPHQYLIVNTGNKNINVDIFGYFYGVPFGDYAHGFNVKLL